VGALGLAAGHLLLSPFGAMAMTARLSAPKPWKQCSGMDKRKKRGMWSEHGSRVNLSLHGF